MREPRERGKLPAMLLAVLIHILFFALLVFGVNWRTREPDPVEVALWSELPPLGSVVQEEPKAEAKPEPKPNPKPKPKPEAKTKPSPKLKARASKPEIADDLKLKKQLEVERREQLEREEKRKREEEKRLSEENRKQQEAKQRAEEEEKRKQEEEQRQKEEKRKQEEEQRKRDETIRLAELKRQEDLRRQEERAKLAAARQQELEQQKRLIDEYKEKIAEKIRQNTIVPETVSGNPRVEYRLVLLPTGEVLSATLAKSSGNKAYDEAVERAILRSQPLPLPPNPELFAQFRELRLPITFQPRSGS